jgi:ATP-dependent protease ClpP protease subunit
MRLKIISDIDSDILQYLYSAFDALKDTNEDVEFDITSYGGDVFAGLAICEKIREFQELGRKFSAYIYGIAASAAADIALSCDHVEMAESSSIMVHSAYRMDGKKDRGLEIANAFQLETIQRRNPDFKSSELKSDKWFTAYEALQAGLVDGVFNVSTNEKFKEAAKLSDQYLAKISTNPHVEGIMEEEKKKEVVEEKKEVAADEIDVADLIERISERLKFIEDRLDKIEGGERAECGNDERKARFKALYEKLGAIVKPAQRQDVVAKETTPEEDLQRMNAKYPNLADIAAKLDR